MTTLLRIATVLLLSLSACKKEVPAAAPSPSVPAAPLIADGLPEGDGKADVARCTICHTAQLITQQRLTRAQWEKTVHKMMGWGAPFDEAGAQKLVTYLASSFPPDKPDDERPRVVPPH